MTLHIPWIVSCNIMAQLCMGKCSRIVWDNKEIEKKDKMMKYTPTPFFCWEGAYFIILAIIHPQVSSYFVWYRLVCIFLMYTHSCMTATWSKFQLFTHTLPQSIFHPICSSLLLCFLLLPSDFSFCSGKGADSNIPEEKQKTCVKLYSDVNKTNLCFRTTTS